MGVVLYFFLPGSDKKKYDEKKMPFERRIQGIWEYVFDELLSFFVVISWSGSSVKYFLTLVLSVEC